MQALGDVVDRQAGVVGAGHGLALRLPRRHYYGLGAFERADFKRLAAQLEALAGSFIVSINDVPEIRAAFAGFAIEPVTVTHMIAGGDDAKPTAELIVSRARRVRERGLF